MKTLILIFALILLFMLFHLKEEAVPLIPVHTDPIVTPYARVPDFCDTHECLIGK